MMHLITRPVRRSHSDAVENAGRLLGRTASMVGAMLVAALVAPGCSKDGGLTSPTPVVTPEPVVTTDRKPDLTISTVSFSPGSPSVDDEITCWAFVRNAGDAPAGPSTLRFRVGAESSPPETPVPALDPGQEYRYERRVRLTVAQDYVLTATADAQNQVTESNEANNLLERTLTVGAAPPHGSPDLIVSNINFSPGSPRAGDEITFWVFVRNVGDAPADPSTLRFKVGGESSPPETAVPSLNAGQEYRHERRVTLTVARDYVATATADAQGQVGESNEGNNRLERNFTVSPPLPSGHPDLIISNINFSPGSPRVGDEITFWVFVKNVGTASADASTLRFQVGGETFPPETAVPALNAGQEYRHERRVTLTTARDYLATATADVRGQVTESNEGNNVSTRSFTVASASGHADLIISNINFSPGSPTVRDEITFWVFVKNVGTATADASTLRFKVGGETFPPETAVPLLDPGHEYRHERRVRLATAGSYMVTATADARSHVPESNEGNNVSTRTFTVRP